MTTPEPPPTDEPNRASEHAIHTELLWARKRPGGLSPRSMAQCTTLCDLLGNGDPEVAHVELSHKILEIIDSDDDIMAIEAATYSLGLCTEADTHLARLEEFGAKHYLDQRQARRYSDKGLKQLARLISTHWTTTTVPEATIIVIGTAPGQLAVHIALRWQRHIAMQQPTLGLWPQSEPAPTPIDTTWQHDTEDNGLWQTTTMTEPYQLTTTEETTIRLVWRGETWPTFITVLTGDIDAEMVKVQTLGAACAVSSQLRLSR